MVLFGEGHHQDVTYGPEEGLVNMMEDLHRSRLGTVSGPLCHLVCSLQTEHYSAEDTL